MCVTCKYEISIFPTFIKSFFNIFAFWVLDAKMAMVWEIDLNIYISKDTQQGAASSEKPF